MTTSPPALRLGIRENRYQFALLVVINGFVGGMVGLERSILPVLAEQEFHVAAQTAVLGFIIAFGLAKAFANYLAGRLSDAWGRRNVLIAGWVLAAPVPFVLMWAPSWGWVIAVNVLLGLSQGLSWSAAVIMKIDLAGPKHRGLAMGINECAGYVMVALAALATGYIAQVYGLRPAPFYLGAGFVVLGLTLSLGWARDTRAHAALESAHSEQERMPAPKSPFWHTTLKHPALSAATQAGLVNNLNDGVAWGLLPLLFVASGLELSAVGVLAAIYPAVWGLGQLLTGGLSDRYGRRGLIAWGMAVQAVGLVAVTQTASFGGFALAMVLLGAGTAMVYPTLLAAIGDVTAPSWRASAVGTYRLWRDLGYVVGALLAGTLADRYDLRTPILAAAALTLASGVVVAVRMGDTRRAHVDATVEPAVAT